MTREQIWRYIRRTGVPADFKLRYDAHESDFDAFREMACRDLWIAFSMAFEYGRAKGYRAAKAEYRWRKPHPTQ